MIDKAALGVLPHTDICAGAGNGKRIWGAVPSHSPKNLSKIAQLYKLINIWTGVPN